jgi:hypothetical protein
MDRQADGRRLRKLTVAYPILKSSHLLAGVNIAPNCHLGVTMAMAQSQSAAQPRP